MNQDITLQQTLTNALNGNQNYYPLALSLSRTYNPSIHSIELTKQLINTQGIKWLEVLERQAVKDYQLVFSLTHQHPIALSILVGVANYKHNYQQLNQITLQLFQGIDQGSQLVWYPLVRLIKNYLSNKINEPLHYMLTLINSKILDKKLTILLELFLQQQAKIENQPYKQQYFTSGFEVYLVIAKLLFACKQVHLKKMIYLPFLKSHHPTLDLVQQGLAYALNYLSNYRKDISVSQYRQHISYELASHALELIEASSKLSELQPIFITQKEIITNTLLNFNLLNLSNRDIEDQLHLQYGIIHQQYGQDLPSIAARCILVSSSQVPALLKTFLLKIKRSLELYTNQQTLSEGLLKLYILHKVIVNREDLATQIAPLIDLLFSNNNNEPELSLITNCRKLRLLLIFGEILKETHFKYLLLTCFQLLGNSQAKSFTFLEAQNIIDRLTTDSNSGIGSLSNLSKLIKQNSSFIINSFLQLIIQQLSIQSESRQEKLYRLVKQLKKFMGSNQREARNQGTKISGYSAIWLLSEVKRLWKKSMKHSPLVFELVQLLKLAIQLIDQDYIFGTSEHIYKVLELLKQPQNIDITDQLIDVLAFAIDAETHISPQLCTIIVSLQNVVNHNNANIIPIVNVLKILNDRLVANHIIYEYPQLPHFLANLYLTYFQNYNNSHHLNLYLQNFEQIASHFQNFLQAYLNSQELDQFKTHILQSIHTMANCQWKDRFFLVLHHIGPTTGYDLYGVKQAAQWNKRGTMKLTYLYYADKLLRNYNEHTLDELTQFHKIFIEKQTRRALQDDPFFNSPFPQQNTKTYVYQALKKLKENKLIDLMDYSALIAEFKLD